MPATTFRTYEGSWSGPRVGDQPVLKVGMADNATATLQIDSIDTHGFRGHLLVNGLVDADLSSIAGAEADVLSGITFSGAPQRVYLAFVATSDGGGEAIAVIALYDENRIEVRVLRGGTQPLYGIFTLVQS
ncbi:MAG: hypothetical protein QM831_23240 [Kofleriaceae bacterium]